MQQSHLLVLLRLGVQARMCDLFFALVFLSCVVVFVVLICRAERHDSCIILLSIAGRFTMPDRHPADLLVPLLSIRLCGQR